MDPLNGIIYPVLNVTGNVTYHLTVSATDQEGRGPHTDTAKVDIYVQSVNRHSPVFVEPPIELRQLEIPEVCNCQDKEMVLVEPVFLYQSTTNLKACRTLQLT